jgi:hypothetical protein
MQCIYEVTSKQHTSDNMYIRNIDVFKGQIGNTGALEFLTGKRRYKSSCGDLTYGRDVNTAILGRYRQNLIYQFRVQSVLGRFREKSFGIDPQAIFTTNSRGKQKEINIESHLEPQFFGQI